MQRDSLWPLYREDDQRRPERLVMDVVMGEVIIFDNNPHEVLSITKTPELIYQKKRCFRLQNKNNGSVFTTQPYNNFDFITVED